MEYKILDKKAFTVLGIRRITPYGGGTWGIVNADGQAISRKITEISGNPCDLGLCFGFGEDGSDDYMCGAVYEGEPVEGFDLYEVPEATWLMFPAQGKISENVLGAVWKGIYGEALPQSGYQQMELPTIEQYVEWDDGADRCHVDVFIPVTK